MSTHSYPEINDIDGLAELRAHTYLEVAGSLTKLPLQETDDPIEVAKAYAGAQTWDLRNFRLVAEIRFSLPPDARTLPGVPYVAPTCGAVAPPRDGIMVTCELESHSEGVDHAGRFYKDGAAVGVRYWRDPSPRIP
ncbi:hypothetical protein [Streptomyces sp. NPDC051132]|uniref:hypothetical protein n=1 Tax=unclassified Streptomyces TaxID=2593676 RepID=UPI00344A6A39